MMPLVRLTWRQFDADWIVFDGGSGNTHQLPALAAGVLMCLEQQPLDRDTLQASLADVLDSDMTGLAAVLDQVLEQLSTLELIEFRRR